MDCPNAHPNPSDASFCATCGAALTTQRTGQALQPHAAPVPAPPPSLYPASYPAPPPISPPPSVYQPASALAVLPQPRGMYTAAAVINWVTLGLIVVSTFGIGIICAAWFVPMTIRMHQGAKMPYRHTSLGVCTLLFCNLISGILLLADDSGKPPAPRSALTPPSRRP